MRTQKEMFWTLVGLWVWLQCESGMTAAIPRATTWQPMDADYITSTDVPWDGDSDYFDPTMEMTAEEEMESTVSPWDEVPPKENPDPDSEMNPGEKGTLKSLLASSEGNVGSATDAPNKAEVTPPGEHSKGTTETHVEAKEVLAKVNSSNPFLEKGTIETTALLSEETVTTNTLLSKGPPSAFSDKQPEAGLLTKANDSGADSSFPAATSNPVILALTSGGKAQNAVPSESTFLPSGSEGEKSSDAAAEETNAGGEVNPTLASLGGMTDAISGPNEETPEPSIDAGSEAAAPSLAPAIHSSNTEELPTEETEAAPDDGHSPSPPPEGDAVAAKEAPSSQLPPSNLPSPGDATFGSTELSDLATASVQPPPDGKADLAAPVGGRGDSDSSPSAKASDVDIEVMAISSSVGPELSTENSAEVPTGESEALSGAKASSSPPENGTADAPSGLASASDPPTGPSELGFDPTAPSPVGFSLALGPSSLLPEDSETATVSIMKEEVEEGSGRTNGDKTPFASSSPEQGPAISGTETPEGENVPADLNSGTASSLNSGGEQTEATEAPSNGSLALPEEESALPSTSPDETLPGPSDSETEATEAPSDGSPALPGGVSALPSTSPDETLPGPSDSETKATETPSDGSPALPEEESALPSTSPDETLPGPADSGTDATEAPSDGSVALTGEGSALPSTSPDEKLPGPSDSGTKATEAPSDGSPALLGEEAALPSTSPDETLPGPSDSGTDATEAPSDGSPDLAGGEATLPSASPDETLPGPSDSGTKATEAPSDGSPALLGEEAALPSTSPDETLPGPSDSGTEATEAPLDGSPALPGGEAALPSTSPDETLPGPSDSETEATEASSDGSPALAGGEAALPSTSPDETLPGPSDSGTEATEAPLDGSPALPGGEAALPSTSPDETLPGPSDSETEATEAPSDGSPALAGGEAALPLTSPDETLPGPSESETEATEAPSDGSPALPGEEATLPSTSPDETLPGPSDSGTKATEAPSDGSPALPGGEAALPSTSPDETLLGPSDSETEATEAPSDGSPALPGEEATLPLTSPDETLPGPSESETEATEAPSDGSPALAGGEAALPLTSPAETLPGPSESETEATEAPSDGSPALPGEEATLPSTSPDETLPGPSDSGTKATEAPSDGSPALPGGEAALPSTSPDETLPGPSDSETEATEAPSDGSPALPGEEATLPLTSPDETLPGPSESETEATEAPSDGSPALAGGEAALPSTSPDETFPGPSDSGTKVTEPPSDGSPALPGEEATLPSTSPDETLPGPSDSGTKATEAPSDGSPALTGEEATLPSTSPDETLPGPSDSGTKATEAPSDGSPALPGGEAALPLTSPDETLPGPSESETEATEAPSDGSPAVPGEEATLPSTSPDETLPGPSDSGSKATEAPSDGSPALPGGEAALPSTSPDETLPGPSDSETEATEAPSDGSPALPGEEAALPSTSPDETLPGPSDSGTKATEAPSDGSPALPGEEAALPSTSPDETLPGPSDSGTKATEAPSDGSPALLRGESALPLTSPDETLPGPSESESEATEAPSDGSPALAGGETALPSTSPDETLPGPSDSGTKATEAPSDGSPALLGGESALPSTSPDETLPGPSDSETEATEAPSNGSPGSPASTQPLPESSLVVGSNTSAEAHLSQENVVEQLGEKSGSITTGESIPQPPSAADGSVAMIHKSPGSTSPPGSGSSDGSLATEGTSDQASGISDSSQPSLGSGNVDDNNLATPRDSGSTENSVLAGSGQAVLSKSGSLGGLDPSSPVAKAGAEIPTGVLGSPAVALGSMEASLQSNGAGGTNIAIDQQPGKASSATLLSPSNPLSLKPSSSGVASTGNVASKPSSVPPSQTKEVSVGKETGKIDSVSEAKAAVPSPNTGLPSSSNELVVGSGKDSSLAAPEGRGDVGSSVSTANKGTSAVSTAGETHPSLSGTQLSSAKKLPPVKSGPGVKVETPPQSSKVQAPGSAEHTLLGKPSSSVPASSSSVSSGSKAADSGPSSSPGSSSLSHSSAEGKPAVEASKGPPANAKASLPVKSDAHLAVSGAASKTSDKKPDSSSQNSKNGKTATANEKSIKSGRGPAVSIPVPSGVSLFPYGASANDKEYVERKVDFNSPLFKPEIGIPLGKTLRDSLYYTDNGQIIFAASSKGVASYPNPPPQGFNGREKVPMIAVFWDNADFSKGSGTTFYQEYVTQNSAKPALVQDVEERIRQYVKSSYSARWTLKITWVKSQAYPAQRRDSRTNTYQAILTTDGYRTYTLFLYQDGGMKWDYTKNSASNVLIGYTSGDGFFRNDDLMSKTPAAKYRPDQFQGYNTDVRGLWLYKLDSRIRMNYRQRCLDWISHEGQPSAWNKNLPTCPCSLQQGLADGRYTRSKKGVLDSRLTLLYSSTPNKYGAGVRCLYSKNNQLVEGRQEKVWKGSRRSSLNNDEELKFYDWCCNQAGNTQFCDKYSQKRPKTGCDGYRLPGWASSSSSSSEEDLDSEERD